MIIVISQPIINSMCEFHAMQLWFLEPYLFLRGHPGPINPPRVRYPRIRPLATWFAAPAKGLLAFALCSHFVWWDSASVSTCYRITLVAEPACSGALRQHNNLQKLYYLNTYTNHCATTSTSTSSTSSSPPGPLLQPGHRQQPGHRLRQGHRLRPGRQHQPGQLQCRVEQMDQQRPLQHQEWS